MTEITQRKINPWSISWSLLFVHLMPLFAIFTGATAFDWIVCGFMYFIRMFFITGFYHRYFSHKTYNTSRWFQFVMAFLAQSSLQKGALWWASHHREHHVHSDTLEDPHSMKHFGFYYSHLGWIMADDYKGTKDNVIRDLMKFPELVWLNKHHWVPGAILGIGLGFLGAYVNGGSPLLILTHHGLSTIFVGFFLSTVILYHGTFSINSIMHKIGNQRYKTGDESRNSLVLALVTLGEGWHNNHHYYQASARQGFFWWEIDITYYMLKMLSWVGLISDLRPVPKHIKDSKDRDDAKRLKELYANAS